MAQDKAYREAEERISEARVTRSTELDLSDIELSELPESIGDLNQKLRTLNLSNNQLATLPESLGDLTYLQTLSLQSNELTALPETIDELEQLETLDLHNNQLTALPESLGQLTQLRELNVAGNHLSGLPESLGQLAQLQTLNVADNHITVLPESMGHLTQLVEFAIDGNQVSDLPVGLGKILRLERFYLGTDDIAGNPLGRLPTQIRNLIDLKVLQADGCSLDSIPDWLVELVELETLSLTHNAITDLPSWVGEHKQLKWIFLESNRLTDLPASIGQLDGLQILELNGNPLNRELAAAYEQGLDAVKAYLRAKAEDQIVLNEAKLILIGEGEVGKTSLLGALRGDDWVENRKTTHGVEVDIKSLVLTDPSTKTEITFNAWDFGGQDIYKHTHQLFFTSPAIYLAVWDPRGGAEKCRVEDWIKLVKHRAYDDERHFARPRILVVATRGGPTDRLAHIDEQTIRDEFGDMIIGFHHVDSRPDDETGNRKGIEELKNAIASTAVGISQVGRSVPKSWKEMLDALRKRSKRDPYISYKQFRALCRRQKVSNELADAYSAILNELGHLIHYRNDSVLQDTVYCHPQSGIS